MAFLALLILVPVAMAQNAQKVTIEDGKVYINGKQVQQDRLPESLKNIDVDTQISFWGSPSAFIQINGSIYAFEQGGIVEADSDLLESNAISVFFSTDESEHSAFKLFQQSDAPLHTYVLSAEPRHEAMNSYVTALNNQALEFGKLKLELQGVAPESGDIARQLVVQAENAARIAQSFPRVQFESYLGEIQGRDQQLYQELLREHEMELRTHQLAQQIQKADSQDAQETLAAELRAALSQIFQLKQDNREEEIEQLTQQLRELRALLDERESLRDDIIESRLKDLLEQHRW